MTAPLQSFLQQRAAQLPFVVSGEQLLTRDAPGGLREPGAVSANGHCRLLAARDGWLAVNLARLDDLELIPAFTERGGPPWPALAAAAGERDAAEFVAKAEEFQLPVACVGEAEPTVLAESETPAPGPVRVVDLSAMWAGPLCAGLLARAGAEVVRVESARRPDPTAIASPRLDAWLNGAKRRMVLDLTSTEGRERLRDEVARAEVLGDERAARGLGAPRARRPVDGRSTRTGLGRDHRAWLERGTASASATTAQPPGGWSGGTRARRVSSATRWPIR